MFATCPTSKLRKGKLLKISPLVHVERADVRADRVLGAEEAPRPR
jgi:hypothetical protein